MHARPSDPPTAELGSRAWRGPVEQNFTRLWSSLQSIPCDRDRQVARDCVRDALDRDADRLGPSEPEILANTYVVEDLAARSPTSLVLRVRHRELGYLRVAKLLTPESANDPLLRRMLLREARHHLAVRDSCIVAAETALRLHDGRLAIVMDHIDGISLADRLRDRPLSELETLTLTARVAGGLSAIHRASLAHLDIAPGNILLSSGIPAKATVCDFGLSRPLGEVADIDVERAATPGFAAPECADRQAPATAAADIFALGAVIEAAIGGAERAPPRFRDFFQHMRARDPADRPDAETVQAWVDDQSAAFGEPRPAN